MRRLASRRVLTASSVALAAVTALAGCGGPGGGGGSGDGAAGGAGGTDPGSFTVLTANENPVLSDQLDALAAGACSAQNEALPLEHQKIAQADTVQRITLLASQDALPPHFIAGTDMVRPDGDLGANDLLQDLQSSGAADNLLPAVVSTEENVYGGVVSMPYQYNIEGIWYNTEIFADAGIAEPTTWDELEAAAATLQESGVIAMTQAGSDGWPLTRLMGMYIFRTVGPDAMAAVRDGTAKLTDPEYVAGAQALADFAAAGYFGEGFSTRDGDTSSNLFLTGQAAMTYDGSWMLSAVNDPERNEIGPDKVGFMPFPAVEGGQGSIDQYPANAGAAMAFAADQYGPKVDDWVSCIAENYGAQALQDAGVVSGFQVNSEVTDVPAPTADIQQRITEIDQTVLWFEALMDPKSNSLASTNATLLTTGQMSPADYMSELQASIDAAAG